MTTTPPIVATPTQADGTHRAKAMPAQAHAHGLTGRRPRPHS